MKTEYFTFKWSMTLFSCFLPCEILVHIFDMFIHDGWTAIYKVGISVLNNFMAHDLFQMDNMMDMSEYFRDQVRKSETFSNESIHKIIIGSYSVNIQKE